MVSFKIVITKGHKVQTQDTRSPLYIVQEVTSLNSYNYIVWFCIIRNWLKQLRLQYNIYPIIVCHIVTSICSLFKTHTPLAYQEPYTIIVTTIGLWNDKIPLYNSILSEVLTRQSSVCLNTPNIGRTSKQ